MTATTKPNFRIIENFSHEDKFEDFKTDYMNGMTKKNLVKKYELTNGVWKDWMERIPDRRPFQNHKTKKPKRLKKHFGEYHHFERTYKGNHSLYRRVDGHKYSYGSYPDRETAEMVCEKLLECGWDKYVAYDLLQEYAVKNSIRVLSSRLLRREI